MPEASSSSSSRSWPATLLALPTTQQGRLVLTALASCSLTAASIFSYQAAVRHSRRRDLAKSVDKATHRDRDVEKKLHPNHASTEDDSETIDGGTPRYLDHLAHLNQSRNSSNHALARPATPLRRENSRSSLTAAHGGSRLMASPSSYDESLIREQLSRNYSFLGEESMQKLRDAFVVVVGLGGVGSHTALSLIRSGVGHIRLIDFDQVSLSSLNRHAVAQLEDVGRPKVIVCQEHFRAIAPWVHIQAWVEIFNESEAQRLFSPFRVPGSSSAASGGREIPPTYVIDCIDNLNTKVGLLSYCHENGIKVFSSMGAGAKCDPTRICIGDLTATEEDPLAKSVRRRLRERGIPHLPMKESALKAAKKAQRTTNTQKLQQTPKKETSPSTAPSQTTPRPSSEAFKSALPEGMDRKRGSMSGPKHMSRASSTSSFGSGEGTFYTPEGTPREEDKSWDVDQVQPPELALDGADGNGDALSRPEFDHRRSSGLESLAASPVIEKEASSIDAALASAAPSSELKMPGNGPRSGQFKKRTTGAISPGRSAPTTPPLTTEAEAEAESETPWTASNPRYMIPCIFSTEKPAVNLLPLDEAEFQKDGGVEMLRALEDGNEWRVRVLPVLGPLPAIFGLSIASFVICDISGKAPGLLEPLEVKVRRRAAERTQKDLEAAERAHPSPSSFFSKSDDPHHVKGRGTPFLLDDIVYLQVEVFHSRSVVPPFASVGTGSLLRWDSTLPLSYQNVALFSRDEAKVHIQEVLKKGRSPVAVWGDEAAEMWRKRMEEERWYKRFR